ncbi:MAG: hypothetical protein WBZ36_19205 [Candidatus Nitrosopolaris sp.]
MVFLAAQKWRNKLVECCVVVLSLSKETTFHLENHDRVIERQTKKSVKWAEGSRTLRMKGNDETQQDTPREFSSKNHGSI